MIFHYISELEKKIIKEFARNLRRLKALNKVRLLLNDVDSGAEEIPVTTKEKLLELLHSLKGRPLTGSEKEVASEIIIIKNKKQ
jgi:hypothetical protein